MPKPLKFIYKLTKSICLLLTLPTPYLNGSYTYNGSTLD